jgi:hypothetical protein
MKRLLALLLVTASLAACKKKSQMDVTAATEVLAAFTKAGADHAALTAALRPKPEDYAAVFTADAAEQAKAVMEPIWDGGKAVLDPSAEQTELSIVGVTPDQLSKEEGDTASCPEGYKGIADKLSPKIVVYCAQFVKPGEKHGLSVDALVKVDDHWALFPKPFRVLK